MKDDYMYHVYFKYASKCGYAVINMSQKLSRDNAKEWYSEMNDEILYSIGLLGDSNIDKKDLVIVSFQEIL